MVFYLNLCGDFMGYPGECQEARASGQTLFPFRALPRAPWEIWLHSACFLEMHDMELRRIDRSGLGELPSLYRHVHDTARIEAVWEERMAHPRRG